MPPRVLRISHNRFAVAGRRRHVLAPAHPPPRSPQYFEAMNEQWPDPDPTSPRPALPSLEELPRTGEGYDPERVEAAFNAFHGHIARLDATLEALQAVEGFSRQASELRNELRAFRRARWEQDWAAAYSRPTAPGGLRMAPALPRIAAEVAFLIAVAVFLGVGHFRSTTIVLVMAAAWLIVGLVEWLVGRASAPAFVSGRSQPVAGPAPLADWPDDDPENGLTMVAELDRSAADSVGAPSRPS